MKSWGQIDAASQPEDGATKVPNHLSLFIGVGGTATLGDFLILAIQAIFCEKKMREQFFKIRARTFFEGNENGNVISCYDSIIPSLQSVR